MRIYLARFLVIFVAFLVAGLYTLLEIEASADSKTPGMVISEMNYNFAEHSETTPVIHDFIVKNSGGAVLNIRDVRPGCGCTIARFDKMILPGAEGKITLELNLEGFQGYVKKTATVLSDDPANPRLVIQLEGTVKPLIGVLPEKNVYFQGMPEDLAEKTVDLVTNSKLFHIRKIDDNLNKNVSYKLETVEDGKHYRLKLSNNIQRGNYRGSITVYTDSAEKPELTVWVNGSIEGEIGIRPKVLIIGRLSVDQNVLFGKVLVFDNKNKPFKILKCTYDERIINVKQEPIPNESGFSLEVTPRIENIPPGSRIPTVVKIETDVISEQHQEVEVQAINLSEEKK